MTPDRPGDAAGVRRRNLGLVLRHIAEHGPCARTEVAAATGLAHGSVTALSSDLVERGLVCEDDAQRGGGRGRPGRPLRLVPGRALSIAVQITSEELRTVVADLAGAVLWRGVVRHDCAPGTPEAMADALAAEVRRAQVSGAAPWSADAGREARRDDGGVLSDAVLARVVIAMAGPVCDDAAQTVLVAADFGWLQPVRLGELVAGRLGPGCPVDVINDGNAAALAEFHARPRPRRGLVLIEAGTGIGGGVVVDGRIHAGSHGIAGEPGHVPVAWDGPECVCGARGCLVCYAGPEAVFEAAGLGEVARREGVSAASGRLVAALETGEQAAAAAVERAGRALAAAVMSISALLDVDEIVLGGTLAQWFPWLLPSMDRTLAGRRALAPAMRLDIVPAVLGPDAMLTGAVEFARRAVLSDPSVVPPMPVRPLR
ncbi:ROK family transcriptional regulator [Nocardia huaxiensis]|uniref:ROK family transcriptional regulator n=1 Tax=Nocardia huaxiensis TaxID=2755382 RepID=A0A7D6VEW9_9NOCA|nr:ROK family transcriptional regulator [Nocardia huaxiensis]